MWRALPTCPRAASPPASRLLSWSGRRALTKTTLSTAFAKALGMASTVVFPPAASENPAYLQGSDRQYRQSALGTAALHRLQQIDWNVEQVVNAARAVESNVWPKPIGEDGQRAPPSWSCGASTSTGPSREHAASSTKCGQSGRKPKSGSNTAQSGRRSSSEHQGYDCHGGQRGASGGANPDLGTRRIREPGLPPTVRSPAPFDCGPAAIGDRVKRVRRRHEGHRRRGERHPHIGL